MLDRKVASCGSGDMICWVVPVCSLTEPLRKRLHSDTPRWRACTSHVVALREGLVAAERLCPSTLLAPSLPVTSMRPAPLPMQRWAPVRRNRTSVRHRHPHLHSPARVLAGNRIDLGRVPGYVRASMYRRAEPVFDRGGFADQPQSSQVSRQVIDLFVLQDIWEMGCRTSAWTWTDRRTLRSRNPAVPAARGRLYLGNREPIWRRGCVLHRGPHHVHRHDVAAALIAAVDKDPAACHGTARGSRDAWALASRENGYGVVTVPRTTG
jgi:hypothetical protein